MCVRVCFFTLLFSFLLFLLFFIFIFFLFSLIRRVSFWIKVSHFDSDRCFNAQLFFYSFITENTVIQEDNRGTKHRPFPPPILNYSFSGESIVTSIYEMEQLLASMWITRVEILHNNFPSPNSPLPFSHPFPVNARVNFTPLLQFRMIGVEI